MVAISPIPQEELKRVATANTDLVDVARQLIGLVARETDPASAQVLREQINRILDSSNTISAAIRSTAYVAKPF